MCPQMYEDIFEVTQAVPEERILEHVVVVRMFHVYVPHIQKHIAEEGGSFHVGPCKHRADEQGPGWPAVDHGSYP